MLLRSSPAHVGSLIFASVLLKQVDWPGLAYFVIEEWKDGFPLPMAFKDAVFAMSDRGEGPFPNWLVSNTSMPVEAIDDPITAVCKTSLYLKTTEVPIKWDVLDTADPVSTQERLQAYLEACREVYSGLEAGSQQKRLLEAFRPSRGVPSEVLNVTAPIYHGPQDPDSYLEMRLRRDDVAAEKPDLTPRLQPVEEAEPPWVRESLRAMAARGVQAVRPEVVPASRVAAALWRGRVVQFDATEILPRELFNLSMVEIAGMHGDQANDIPVYRQRGATAQFGWSSLSEAGQRIKILAEAGRLYHGDQVPVPREPKNVPVQPPFVPWEPELALGILRKTYNANLSQAFLNLEQKLDASPRSAGLKDTSDEAGAMMLGVNAVERMHALRRTLSQTTTNVRRLPRLPMVDLREALGSPSWVERSWSMLWTGAVSSWWHNDEPDNLLIAVNREVTVAVFEMGDTDDINGLRGPVQRTTQLFDLQYFHPDKVNNDWLEANPWIKKFPYIRVHLKPGMGVTVPSRTYHSIWSQDSDRILLNAFLIPKYGALEQAPRPQTCFFKPGFQNETYMALMHLKYSSLGRLWDTRKLGGFFEIHKLEIF